MTIKTFKGITSTATLSADKIVISGKSATHEIKLADLDAIQHQLGGSMGGGYLKLCRDRNDALTGSGNPLSQAMRDHYALLFSKKRNAESEAFVKDLHAAYLASTGKPLFMVEPPSMEQQKKSLKKAAIWGTVIGVILLVLLTSGESEKEAATRVAAEQAQEQAKLAKYKATQAIEQRKEDEARADAKGMAYEDFMKAKDRFTEAYLLCTMQVKEMAKWGAKQDLLPKVSWEMQKGRMIITGRDIRIKNGFNAERYVKYVCAHDMETNETKVISVK